MVPHHTQPLEFSLLGAANNVHWLEKVTGSEKNTLSFHFINKEILARHYIKHIMEEGNKHNSIPQKQFPRYQLDNLPATILSSLITFK